ncbi:MAG: hypothetical protein ABEJ08_04620 [Halobacteriaceae archaeon]
MTDLTVSVEGPDGSADVTLPEALVEALGEGDERPEDVVVNVTLMAFAQRAHALVHHSGEDVPADLEAAEEQMRDAFEERFGVAFSEAIGHEH